MYDIGLNSRAVSPADVSLGALSANDAITMPPQELAEEFESLFIAMLVKQMRESSSEEGLFPGDSADTYGGLFDMYLGRHIAHGGGIGLAASILPAIERETST